ncbi:unnamed protein product [Musa acuminata var. zebrina]
MTEVWVIEVGLSPMPREMVNLMLVRGGRSSSTSSPSCPVDPCVGTREAPMVLEGGCPRKKAKRAALKKPTPPVTRPREVADESGSRDRRPGSNRGEAGPSNAWTGKAPREPSIRDLCRLPTTAHGESYQARVMGGLPDGRPSDPLEARWTGLTRGTRVWADGEVATVFVRGGLHPDMAWELYNMPSDVLLGKSASRCCGASIMLWH